LLRQKPARKDTQVDAVKRIQFLAQHYHTLSLLTGQDEYLSPEECRFRLKSVGFEGNYLVSPQIPYGYDVNTDKKKQAPTDVASACLF